jgi:hypothetical protein
MKMKAIILCSFKILVTTYETTWCHNSETKISIFLAMRTSNLTQCINLNTVYCVEGLIIKYLLYILAPAHFNTAHALD